MPLYEYKCNSCGKTFEVLQKFADAPLTTHEDCGGKVERLISAPAFHLKGTGWYVTDYGKGNSRESAKSSEAKSSESKSAETKSESKSESSSAATGESKSEPKPSTN